MVGTLLPLLIIYNKWKNNFRWCLSTALLFLNWLTVFRNICQLSNHLIDQNSTSDTQQPRFKNRLHVHLLWALCTTRIAKIWTQYLWIWIWLLYYFHLKLLWFFQCKWARYAPTTQFSHKFFLTKFAYQHFLCCSESATYATNFCTTIKMPTSFL